MKLLFIYFYKDFGTFEKGSIIHLSKKYKFTLDEKKSAENEFYFDKEENPDFIDDFYSKNKNIDIGVLIGENGTGKSVLLNSIRDRNNEYSIFVYEEENEFYGFSNQKEIFIENQKITEKELNYIYYTSLIDAFDNDINDKYNISNRAFLKKHDGKNLDVKLSLIENDDIQKFIKIKEKINYDVRINGLKINYKNNFFSQLKEKIFQKEFENIYPIFIDKIKNKIKIIDVNLFSTEEEIYYNNIFRLITNDIKDEDLFEHIKENIDFYLVNNSELLRAVSLKINDNIGFSNEFKKQKQQIKLYFEDKRVLESLDNFFNSSNYTLENFNFLESIKNKKIIYNEDIGKISQSFEDIFSEYLNINNVYSFIDDEEICNFISGHHVDLYYTWSELYDEFIKYIFNYFNLKNKALSKFLIFKYRSNFLYGDVDNNLNISNKKNTEDLKYLKLQFDLMYHNYDFFNNIEKITKISILKSIRKGDITNLYFKIESIYIRKWLLILYLEDKYAYEVLLPKINLINKFIKILESNDEIINDKNIFDNLENDANLNEKLLLNISNENIIEVNDDFFDFYKKLIEHEFEPFTYELYPSLSSGQKAILFIFARINNAIEKIKQENPNENILILLDEADLKLHLEWQRKFVYDLIKFLNSYSNNKFYILYATHSPMILSDITNDRVVFLKKKDEKYSEDKQDFTKSTFGANIYDIYADSFFVDDFMGEFAQNKINDIIKIIDEYKEKKEKNPDEFMPNEKALDNLKIVKNIGEPLLRNKLEDEIKSLVKDDIMEIVNNLKNKKNEEIEKELENYSQFTQTKVLMKLLEIRK